MWKINFVKTYVTSTWSWWILFFTGKKVYRVTKFCILMTSGFIHIKYIYIYTSHDFMYVFVNINCTTRLLVMDILFTHLPGYVWGTTICFSNRLFFSEILFLKELDVLPGIYLLLVTEQRCKILLEVLFRSFYYFTYNFFNST